MIFIPDFRPKIISDEKFIFDFLSAKDIGYAPYLSNGNKIEPLIPNFPISTL